MVLMANMQVERPRVGECCHNHELDGGLLMESTPPSKFYSNSSSPLVLQPCSFSSGGGRSSVGGGGLGHIEHTVSKFDTLVGVAIKYGVEVADIKKMNGLTTDYQMFALKSLQIPLPGRHPPSPIISNGPTNSKATPTQSDLFNSIKSLKLSSSSPQTPNSSRGYYGHNQNDQNSFEMAVYQYSENEVKDDVNRKSKSLFVNGLSKKSGEVAVTNNDVDNSVRRRKSEVDLNNTVKQENHNNKKGSVFSQKVGSLQNLIPLANALMVETLTGVRKSLSTPNFDDSNNNNNATSASSIWRPTSMMMNLTADIQALSTAAISIPMFDGLPKPVSARKNKASLD